MKNKIIYTLCFIVTLSFGCNKKPKINNALSDFEDFRNVCIKASQDDAFFAHFKRDPIFNLMHEYTTLEEGLEYLKHIRAQFPEILLYADRFRENDTIGDPRIFSFPGIGSFSPSTIRYMKMATDLCVHFGSLKGMKILEIGGGYGGLCRILKILYPESSYTIIDLPHAIQLAKKTLSYQNILDVSYQNILNQLVDADSYDLVISFYGFSELSKELQKKVVEKFFKKAKNAYLVCDVFPRHYRVNPYSQEEFMQKLQKEGISPKVMPESPLMAKDNYVVMWKNKQ